LLLDRAREAGRRLRLEAAPGLTRVRVDRVDRDLRQLAAGAVGAADQDLEDAASAAASRS